jgi:hypothetical protein
MYLSSEAFAYYRPQLVHLKEQESGSGEIRVQSWTLVLANGQVVGSC